MMPSPEVGSNDGQLKVRFVLFFRNNTQQHNNNKYNEDLLENDNCNRSIVTIVDMGRAPKTASAASSAASGDDSGDSAVGEFEWSAPKTPSNPLFPNVSDPQIPYTLPAWLFPERHKDKQSNASNARVFSIPLPTINPKTEKAVKAYLAKHHPQQKSGMKESERKLKELRMEEKQASAKAKQAKDKLAQALLAKSDKHKEIRKEHELETQKALEALEAKMRQEDKQEAAKIREKIREECKKEYEKKFEEEMIIKRKRDREEDEKEEQAAAKKAKEEEEAKEAKDTSGDGDASGEKAAAEDDKKEISKVQELEKKKDDLKQDMEKLSEKKREFYWLLKQVIKQEAMQKAKMMKLKKAEAK